MTLFSVYYFIFCLTPASCQKFIICW